MALVVVYMEILFFLIQFQIKLVLLVGLKLIVQQQQTDIYVGLVKITLIL